VVLANGTKSICLHLSMSYCDDLEMALCIVDERKTKDVNSRTLMIDKRKRHRGMSEPEQYHDDRRYTAGC